MGSYFHFAGGAPAAAMAAEMGVDVGTEDDVYGAGWRGLRAYDYFENAEEKESGLFSGKTADAVGADGKPVTPLFVVQADRALDVLPGAGLVMRGGVFLKIHIFTLFHTLFHTLFFLSLTLFSK